MGFAAININFDSVGNIPRATNTFEDPTFGCASDRFMFFAEKYKFKYSIYVIGQDLLNSKNNRTVYQWHKNGHEIGNHSWSHKNNLGALSRQEIEDEIYKADSIIKKTIGHRPLGFIAPGWTFSEKLLSVLQKAGYEYDTSLFPSWLMYPVLAKLLFQFWGDKKKYEILQRHDKYQWLCGSRKPYRYSTTVKSEIHNGISKSNLIEMPLPTTRFRMACWHTVGFMLGWSQHFRILKQCLKDHEFFYYLVHPADLMDSNDIQGLEKVRIARIHIPLRKKLYYFEKSLCKILESQRQLVTMHELTKYFCLRGT